MKKFTSDQGIEASVSQMENGHWEVTISDVINKVSLPETARFPGQAAAVAFAKEWTR